MIAMKVRKIPYKKVLLWSLGSCGLLIFLICMYGQPTFHWTRAASIISYMSEKQVSELNCLSRTHKLLNQKNLQKFAMSAKLDKAWRQYGEMHRLCSNGKNLKNVFLNRQQENNTCKYLVFLEPRYGLGNRILALVSAFMYALATDRVLLIEPKKLLEQLLCEPFPGSHWLLPRDFPTATIAKSPTLGAAIKAGYRNMDVVNLHLEHTHDWGDDEFLCDNTHQFLKDIRWLGWTSNQYYVSQLFMIPSLWERLDPLFPSKTEVFPQLARLILLPRNDVWKHIEHVYQDYDLDSMVQVGVQVRTLHRKNSEAFDPVIHKQIVDCLLMHKVLPDAKTQGNLSELPGIFPTKHGAWQVTEISVLVASLQVKYYDELKAFYRDNPSVHVHMVSHLGHQDKSVHQAHFAFLEMWLLSFSNVIATSAFSTFGYVAQGIGGLQPLILNIMGENSEHDGQPLCTVGQSSEPCTQFPLKPFCKATNTTVEHQNWISQHLNACQDDAGGLQLVESVKGPQ
ncbi:hypothetical protein BDL97_01G085800 [Sphagnum fallax]|nr:hypothetical protein BDL97_01G085800 [Sphagnum fallax]KAH8974130.1 hypothetical protein BDL97_01G085800 [Sphagnum fallax]KAH8974131.1 hypothetical protein BDL97_01G085800 [Sphagnum fallax]KAH8974132.1 hypothetical protein BDL97_01G085800 [Sphagnum fallax]KAH8974133.1 hypothetical protein BDL97_01G085800 [Sphagnum fallax]